MPLRTVQTTGSFLFYLEGRISLRLSLTVRLCFRSNLPPAPCPPGTLAKPEAFSLQPPASSRPQHHRAEGPCGHTDGQADRREGEVKGPSSTRLVSQPHSELSLPSLAPPLCTEVKLRRAAGFQPRSAPEKRANGRSLSQQLASLLSID